MKGVGGQSMRGGHAGGRPERFGTAAWAPSETVDPTLIATGPLFGGKPLEGYLLREDCLEKAIRLGLNEDDIPVRSLLCTILQEGRTLGLLRLLSERQSLKLPFQGTAVYIQPCRREVDPVAPPWSA